MRADADVQCEEVATAATNTFVIFLAVARVLLAVSGVRFVRLQRSRAFQIKAAYMFLLFRASGTYAA